MQEWMLPIHEVAFPLRFLAALFLISVLLVAANQHVTFSANDFFVGPPPRLYYQTLPEDMEEYPFLGIAHNSGNRIRALNRTLAIGAASVEIDVIAVNGKLYAAHKSSPPIASLFYKGVPLSKAWNAAGEAEVIKLDLKKTGAQRVDLLVRFLEQNSREGQTILVTSSDRNALERLGASSVDTVRLLSVRHSKDLARMLESDYRAGAYEGVSIRYTLLDSELADWLKARRLLVFAWTVNDVSLLAGLVHLGVHGLMTDNLAIANLLSIGTVPQLAAPPIFAPNFVVDEE